jgi:DeoR/GlpR family transcriptional regulator of sugar metabolism
MPKFVTQYEKAKKHRDKLKKSERRKQILLELKLRPHIRIAELAERFKVSAETVRRDFEALSQDGLISRAHGGASAPSQGHYPSLKERSGARSTEREGIGRRAAELVRDGETVMIDSGSTTIHFARALAYLGTQCTVITNSIPVAITIGDGAPRVILCPGEYLQPESAVIGDEAVEFLSRFNVDHCMIGATGLSVEGPSENVRGFAAVKRTMLRRAARRHLLIDSEKFGRKGLAQVGDLADLDSVVVDRRPKGELLSALDGAGVSILLADQD